VNKKKFSTDYLVYLALRVLVMVLHMFHWRTIYGVARWAGDVWYRVDGRHRERAAEHLRASFGDWDEDRIQRTVRGSFRHMVYLTVEVLLTTRLLTYWKWRRRIVLSDMPELFRILLDQRRGLIFVAGHFGGWEVIGCTMASLGFDGYAVARPLDNPYLNDYLFGVREKMGLKILDKQGAAERINDILPHGDHVGFIADQDAGPRGVFVNFFGRKASSYKAPGLMAMRYGVPILVGYGERLGEQYRFRIGIERIIEPGEWADKPDPLRWITQEYTSALERVIRRAPEQYLWIYRRWKTRPPDQRNETEVQTAVGN
jgi:KDO2-lipid IV(A) lauroyltransferase